MRTTALILIPTLSYGSYNPGYPNYNPQDANNWAGDPQPAASYYRTQGSLQTVMYNVANFSGSLAFEATLDSSPSDSTSGAGWFTVGNVTGLGANTYTGSTDTTGRTVILSEIFYGDGVTVNFTLQDAFPQDSIIVTVNGILQIPGISYTVTGRSLVLTEAPLADSLIEVREFYVPVAIDNINSEVFVATGRNNTFTLSSAASYNTNGCVVSVNGIVQIPIQSGSPDPVIRPIDAVTVGTDLVNTSVTFGTMASSNTIPPVGSNITVNSNLNPQFSGEHTVVASDDYTITVTYPTTPGSWTMDSAANIVIPVIGSYWIDNTGSNANAQVNTLTFDWTPLSGDKIEVREIVSGTANIPTYSGAGVLNIEGNFTWIRCRVLNWRAGDIRKITMSY